MLWLEWEGGQLPIGWDDNRPFATVDSLFDTSWNVYKGENNGMAVVSPFQCTLDETPRPMLQWWPVRTTRLIAQPLSPERQR